MFCYVIRVWFSTFSSLFYKKSKINNIHDSVPVGLLGFHKIRRNTLIVPQTREIQNSSRSMSMRFSNILDRTIIHNT